MTPRPPHIQHLVDAWQLLGDAQAVLRGGSYNRNVDGNEALLAVSQRTVIEAFDHVRQAQEHPSVQLVLSGELEPEEMRPKLGAKMLVIEALLPVVARTRTQVRAELERLSEGHPEWLVIEDRLPPSRPLMRLLADTGMVGAFSPVAGLMFLMVLGDLDHPLTLVPGAVLIIVGPLWLWAATVMRRKLLEEIVEG